MLGNTKREEIPSQFCGGVGDDGEDSSPLVELLLPPLLKIREDPNLPSVRLVTSGIGPDASSGMDGVASQKVLFPGRNRSLTRLMLVWKLHWAPYPVSLFEEWAPGWDLEDIADMAGEVPLPTSGVMVVEMRTSRSPVGIAGAGAFVHAFPWVLG